MRPGKMSRGAEGGQPKRLLALALSTAMALGQLPATLGGTLTPVYAAEPKAYADYDVTTAANKDKTGDALAELRVTFNGKAWYVIKDESTAAGAGTLTLLAADNIAKSKFADSGNKYGSSTVKDYLDGLTAENGAFADAADAIETVKVKGSDSDTEVEAKLYLLNYYEAKADNISDSVRSADDNWWLRDSGLSDASALFVSGRGYVGLNTTIDNELGVRPALKLKLDSVLFDSESKAFSLKPTHNPGSESDGWRQASDGTWSYVKGGTKVTGWSMLDGTWYLFDSDGAMATGWRPVSGSWYYFGQNGAMATGWRAVNGTWYYLDPSGAMATGWRRLGAHWYYLQGSGAMATGWQLINGTWYFFHGSGAMASSEWVGSYWCDASGAWRG